MSKTVSANTSIGRLNAALDEDGMVHVWRSGGSMLGLYRLDRFHGAALTSGTLYDLFHVPKKSCVGCFQSDGHAKGCPTGQNGAPNYN